MIGFRNTVKGEQLKGWWDNDGNQIAFSRGSRGFVAFNIESTNMNQVIQTSLPPGTYCDVITGKSSGNVCTGKAVWVGADGKVLVQLAVNRMLAIHVNVRDFKKYLFTKT